MLWNWSDLKEGGITASCLSRAAWEWQDTQSHVWMTDKWPPSPGRDHCRVLKSSLIRTILKVALKTEFTGLPSLAGIALPSFPTAVKSMHTPITFFLFGGKMYFFLF